MSLALYRKYRPGSFAEVKGQEHVTGPLRQALTNGRVHHAYLFSGPRGCGKTSSARILARSLNCAQGPTPDPCGVCDSCVALAPNGSGSLDVIEIDAASHNGVDDARDLRDKAFYAPVSGRFKVYIIDEAHMVTPAAFNALLKLVEEPPEFVKFVFATTEPEKVLLTIRSRTHHYPFRLMARRDLTALLSEVVASEGIAVEPQVIPLVVRAAAGSARDAMSILDQVLASAGAAGVTREAAAGLLGVTHDVLLDDVLDAFSVGDAAAIFATVDQVMEGGHDPRRFGTDVLERLRDLIILDAVPDAVAKGVLDCPPEQVDRMARQAAALGPAGLSRAADLFHAGLTEMRGTTAPRLLLELICARVLLPAATADSSAVLTRVERLERRIEIGAVPAAAAPPLSTSVASAVAEASAGRDAADTPTHGRRPAGTPASLRDAPGAPADAPVVPAGSWPVIAVPGGGPDTTPTAPTAPTPTAPTPTASRPAAPDTPAPSATAGPPEPAQPVGLDAAAVRKVWDDVLAKVKQAKRVTHARLSETQVSAVAGNQLSVSFTTATLARQFGEGVHVDVLREALREVLGLDLRVVCVSGAAHTPVPAETSPRGAPRGAPAAPRDGFAPGDEPSDEDEVPGPAPRAVRSDDDALRLVEQALGGRVVGTIGE